MTTHIFDYAYATGPVGSQDTKDSNILKINTLFWIKEFVPLRDR